MNILRLICLWVIAFVLPVNTVLAQLPAHTQMATSAAHIDSSHHTEHHQPMAESAQSPELHVHHGLFGQTSVHVHEPAPPVDCAKACQVMSGSPLLAHAFIEPLPLSAILVAHSGAALRGVTVPPLEDPPKVRA